jgi:purine-binding chemotaxis protein CheW
MVLADWTYKMLKAMKKELPSERMDEIAETVEGLHYAKEDLYEREELKEQTRQIVVLRLSREWYGVEITNVKEVTRVGKITYLPSSPEYIAGIVNLRGKILSITDLKTMMGLAHEEPTDKARIIAVESGILETGLLVDEVVESIEVPISKIEPPLVTLRAEQSEYIQGQCKVDDKLIALISIERILEKGSVKEESHK